MDKYNIISKLGEGTFSEVLKVECVKDGQYHACKCMKHKYFSVDKVNKLREIQVLRKLSQHPNIVKLIEVIYDQPTGRLALVFELIDCNLYELISERRKRLNFKLVKLYLYQLFKALNHIHQLNIFHRDVKPENILVQRKGSKLKLADFGSCRVDDKGLQPFTDYISTRWYRAPECLLTKGYYGAEMDIWGAGCVMYEIITFDPLFPGSNELDQIDKIHQVLGSPTTEVLVRLGLNGAKDIKFNFPHQVGKGVENVVPPTFNSRGSSSNGKDCLDLLKKTLKYVFFDRITARETMKHPFFDEIKVQTKKAHQNILSASNLSHNKNKNSSTLKRNRFFPIPKIKNETEEIALGQPPAQISTLPQTERISNDGSEKTQYETKRLLLPPIMNQKKRVVKPSFINQSRSLDQSQKKKSGFLKKKSKGFRSSTPGPHKVIEKKRANDAFSSKEGSQNSSRRKGHNNGQSFQKNNKTPQNEAISQKKKRIIREQIQKKQYSNIKSSGYGTQLPPIERSNRTKLPPIERPKLPLKNKKYVSPQKRRGYKT